MAGLLDIFNNMSPEQNQGLLAAAANILQQSSPGRPFTLGQAMGTGISAYQGSMEHQRARQLAEQEAQQVAELRGYAIKDKRSDYEAQEMARAREAKIAERLAGLSAPGAAPVPQMMASAMPGGDGSPKIGGPGWLQAYQQQNGLQLPQAPGAGKPVNQTEAYVQRLLAEAQIRMEERDTVGASKLYEQVAKLRPEFDTTPRTANGPDGKPFQYIVGKRGEIQRLDGMLPREELKLANLNDRDVAYNPYEVTPGQTFQRGVSPDTRANNAVTMRGQNMADARARELNSLTREGQQSLIINDPVQGPMLVNKGTGQARQVMMNGQAVPGESMAKRAAAAKNLMPLIGQAEKLIDGATGSYYGAAVDQGARLFGAATGGAQNIAQLRVLEGNIMMAQPRMEGPQSNMDVELYRQMAAQIGDPTVPNATKKAALSTLRTLYEKYDSGKPAAPTAGGRVPSDIGALLDKYGGY
jgi:hypothetical protein